MKKNRFTEEQMVKILREADATPVAEVAKKHSISAVTIYAWRKRFGKLEAVDVKRLRALEQENAQVRRQQVAYVCEHGRSKRQACALLPVARSTMGYESRSAKCDAQVVAAMKELAGQYPRYGYRRMQVLLGRCGHVMSAERTHRIWRQAGLQVPKKRPRKRAAVNRPRPLPWC